MKSLMRILLCCLLTLASARAVVVTADGNVPVPTLQGYSYKCQALGTWGGATVTLQTYVDGSWQAIPSSTFTADFEAVRLASSREMRAVISGATGATSLSVTWVEQRGTEGGSGGTAGLGTAATLDASTVGGANKVLQMDSNGNLTLGPTYSGSTQFAPNGNLFMPDLHGIQWYKRDGTLSGYRIFPWEQHDVMGGEFLIESPWRIALAGKGPVQMGVNDANRNAYCLWLVTGTSTITDQYRASKAILQPTEFYNSGSPITRTWGHQAWPISSTESVLRFAVDAGVDGFAGYGGPTATTGDMTGDTSVEFHRQGVWSRGTAPTFEVLPPGATITQTCSKYRTVQSAKVTLNQNSTLVISAPESGMRGVIYAKQDSTGSRTLTLPTNSAKASSFALSTPPGQTDRLQWEFDGSFYFWTIANGIEVPLDADTSIFIDAGRANITDAGQKDALNNLVVSLKAASLWAKFSVLYPFVGGNATAHSRNLKSTSYDITWSGSPTHNANGITGDDTAAYGNTNFNMAVLAQNSASMYTYCRTTTPTTSGKYLLGGTNGVTSRALMLANTVSANLEYSLNATSDSSIAASNDFSNHLAINRSASGTDGIQTYIGATRTLATSTSVAPWTSNMFLLARNSTGSPNGYTSANLAFVAFGQSLTDAEWAAFRAIIDTFQSALGRAN